MFTFTVNLDGAEPYRAEAKSRDVVAWERGGRGRSLGKLSESPQMGDLYSLAHVACRRLALFTGTLPEFEAQCDLTFEESEPADPTRTAP
jgi:hypothetical protein